MSHGSTEVTEITKKINSFRVFRDYSLAVDGGQNFFHISITSDWKLFFLKSVSYDVEPSEIASSSCIIKGY